MPIAGCRAGLGRTIAAAGALCVLVALPLAQPLRASDTPPMRRGEASPADGLRAANHFDSYVTLDRRWTGRLATTLSSEAAAAAEAGGTTPARTGVDERSHAGHTQLLAPTRQPSPGLRSATADGNADSGTASTATVSSRRLGDWLVLRVFAEHGLLPLVPAALAAIAGAWVLRRRALHAAQRRLMSRNGGARHSVGIVCDFPEPGDDRTATETEAFDFTLPEPAAAPANAQEITEITELRLRAEELAQRIAEPEQRRKLGLVFSYIDLRHTVAARALIDDIEHAERLSWKTLFG